MKIQVNGESHVVAEGTVAEVMVSLGFAEATVATALNGQFLPQTARSQQQLKDGDALEILAPMQGG